jgi:single-stranded DNA-binding protein
MQVEGKVKVINPLMNVSATFVKQELVVTTEEQYPQHILINFVQDKVDNLVGLKIGDQVKVSINLRGREWSNPQGEVKYFNDIQGWKIERQSAAQQPQAQQPLPTPSANQAFPATAEFTEEEHDDLPF